jgi:hypothetical protein
MNIITSNSDLKAAFPGYQRLVEVLGEELHPEGDWPPALAFRAGNDFKVVPADPLMALAAADPMAATRALVHLVESESVDSFALIATAWQAPSCSELRPSEHPERSEMLLLTVGDGNQQQILCADIVREHRKSPRLASWIEADGDPSPHSPYFRMFDGVNMLLREVNAFRQNGM